MHFEVKAILPANHISDAKVREQQHCVSYE